MRLSEIDSPALVVDLDVLERNLARAAAYAHEHGLRMRPHTKTHKSIALAKRQLHAGAAGLTVAKTSEAEVMLRAGPAEILVAYPVIGAGKLRRLAEAARRARICVALDSAAAAQGLSEAAVAAGVEIGVLAEFDIGMGRVGVSPGELLDLARAVRNLPALSLQGIAFFPGHIRTWDAAGQEAFANAARVLESVLLDFARAGIPVPTVSGGSTPLLFHSHRMPGLTEIRPGTYIFNDASTVECGACAWEDCAAAIVVTVVSTARPGQAIVDGGSKTFSSDRLPGPAECTFGRILEAPGARFHRMTEEHGFIDVTRAERSFAVGDRVRIVPNHVCTALNLHDEFYGIRGGAVEEVFTVDARGKLQ